MNTTINLQYTTIQQPLPDFIYEKLKSFSDNANSYHPQPTELIEKISGKFNIPQEMLYLTAGIDEALHMFMKAYGQNTYIFEPTYVVYSDVNEMGGKLNVITAIKNHTYSIPVRHLSDASLIILANPNNPAGFTEKEKIVELVKENPHAIVIIDEAYSQLANFSMIDEVKNYQNMVVLRSFSKDYGMAGNRIGFITADPKIIGVVKNKTQWSNVSYLSVGAAMAALDNEPYFEEMRKGIISRREDFIKFLQEKGYTTFPSKINAVLIKFNSEHEAQSFIGHLKDNDIQVSHGNGNSNIGLDKSYVRIAIGTEEQMSIVKQVIGTHE